MKDTRHPEYRKMCEAWDLIHDLLGGTRTMRKAGQKWLPKEDGESDVSYKVRLSRTVLFNGLGDTLDKVSSKPFSKPVTLSGTLSPKIELMPDNIDLEGSNLTDFGKDVFKSAATFGLVHVLVDYPFVPVPKSVTKADEKPFRPSFTLVPAPLLTDWAHEVSPSGEKQLTWIKIRTESESVDEYDVSSTSVRLRVIWKDKFEIWEKKGNEQEFSRIEEGIHTFGTIPLKTCYFSRKDFMVADVPFEDLAWINLSHWQSYSDQRNILRFSRAAILFGRGWSATEIEKGLEVGGSSVNLTQDINATLEYVEHSGAAIKSGQEDLTDLERKMQTLGLQPMIQKAQVTATAKMIDESKAETEVQAWIRSVELLLKDCFQLARRWLKEDEKAELTVNIFSEFYLSSRATEDATFLYELWSAGAIDDERLLIEIKRRGFFSEDADIKDMLEKMKAAAKEEAKNAKDQLDKQIPPGSGDPTRDPFGKI